MQTNTDVTIKNRVNSKKKPTKAQLKRQKIKDLIKGKKKPDPVKLKINQMLTCYQNHLRTYHKNTFLKPGGRDEDGNLPPGTVTTLKRVCALADSLEVDYDLFVKAQFWAFDKWFGKPPKLYQLATSEGNNSAKERVRQYQEAVKAEETNDKRSITSRTARVSKTPVAVILHKNELVFRQFVKNWKLTPEEVFTTFAKTPLEAQQYFDKRWLDQNELYQKLRKEGIID